MVGMNLKPTLVSLAITSLGVVAMFVSHTSDRPAGVGQTSVAAWSARTFGTILALVGLVSTVVSVARLLS
jgi:hypothetical protein